MRNINIANNGYTLREELSVSRYLVELARMSLLSPEEEASLAGRAALGDAEAARRLAAGNLRFVVSIAKRYQNQRVTLADLISEGNLGLLEATRRFDPARGCRFISYAVWWVRVYIVSYLQDHGQAIRLPKGIQEIRTKAKRLETQFQAAHGRPPLPEELAEAAGITAERLREAQLSPAVAGSSAYAEEDAAFFNLVDIMADQEALPDMLIDPDEHQAKARLLLARLSARDREILELAFGLNGRPETSNIDIGRRYGMSPEVARLAIKRAVKVSAALQSSIGGSSK